MTTKPIKKYFLGMPCMLSGDVVVRIIGEGEDCTWAKVDGEKIPSIVKVSTPHGTIFSSGICHINEITVDGLKKLLNFEEEVYKTKGELYEGKLNSVLNPIDSDMINTILPTETNHDTENKRVSNLEITEKTKGFSGNMDTKYGYEAGWQHARDYYENNVVQPKNKLYIEDYKSFEVRKDEHFISKENAEFIWSLMPFWIKYQPDGLDPTFYATQSIEGDKEISNKVKSILFNKKTLNDNSTDPLPNDMSEVEKSFMDDIDKYLYWRQNPNVLEIFRKYRENN